MFFTAPICPKTEPIHLTQYSLKATFQAPAVFCSQTDGTDSKNGTDEHPFRPRPPSEQCSSEHLPVASCRRRIQASLRTCHLCQGRFGEGDWPCLSAEASGTWCCQTQLRHEAPSGNLCPRESLPSQAPRPLPTVTCNMHGF